MMNKATREFILDLQTHGIDDCDYFAHKYQVSERTIQRRIDKMLEMDLIRLVVAPNVVLLGYKGWARIGIKVIPGYLDRVARRLMALPMIFSASYVLGSIDIVASVCFESVGKIVDFVNSQLMRIKGIQSTEIFLLVYPRKYNSFSWPAPISFDFDKLKASSNGVLDEFYKLSTRESRILDLLITEGVLSSTVLSQKIGVSISTARNCLNKMWQNDVYKTEVVHMAEGAEELGNANIGITIHGRSAHLILDDILAKSDSVYLASVCIGRFDIYLGARFSNPATLNRFVTTVLPSIPGINSTETFMVVQQLKHRNVTWPIP